MTDFVLCFKSLMGSKLLSKMVIFNNREGHESLDLPTLTKKFSVNHLFTLSYYDNIVYESLYFNSICGHEVVYSH